ncbi:Asp23/Gls24 family envelope stress response protein, partial [Nocardiopsis halotolerans]|uniref:Asp23/Gls24 family envelope stress response protein n=1 Tax=Nocardiopsis halotolerans TaxID=124252 RepID=UPI000360D049
MKTETKVPGARESGRQGRGDARDEGGHTQIADGVVAKIAGMAAREIGGVHAMGGGTARAVGAVRDAVTRSGDSGSVSRGVAVEVGERQAAVDIDLVVEYGAAIRDLAAAVRRNVTSAVERMTGLEVTEINIRVDDIHLP